MADRIVNGRRRSDDLLLDTALQDFYGAADEMGLSESLVSIVKIILLFAIEITKYLVNF